MLPNKKYVIPKPSNIVVSYHAQQRFMQRFRAYFFDLKITSAYMWNDVIAAQVSSGHVCYKWQDCPFWVNKVHTKHGKVFVIKRNPCYYIVRELPDKKLKVCTVVNKWYND